MQFRPSTSNLASVCTFPEITGKPAVQDPVLSPLPSISIDGTHHGLRTSSYIRWRTAYRRPRISNRGSPHPVIRDEALRRYGGYAASNLEHLLIFVHRRNLGLTVDQIWHSAKNQKQIFPNFLLFEYRMLATHSRESSYLFSSCN